MPLKTPKKVLLKIAKLESTMNGAFKKFVPKVIAKGNKTEKYCKKNPQNKCPAFLLLVQTFEFSSNKASLSNTLPKV